MEIDPIKHGILVLTLICVKSVMQYLVMQLRKVTSRIASKL